MTEESLNSFSLQSYTRSGIVFLTFQIETANFLSIMTDIFRPIDFLLNQLTVSIYSHF